MKTLTPNHRQKPSGHTFVELMISISAALVISGVVFLLWRSGTYIYMKVVQTNVAHQNSRIGVQGMVANIAAAVQAPCYVDSNGMVIASGTDGTGAGAGIRIRKLINTYPVVGTVDPLLQEISIGAVGNSGIRSCSWGYCDDFNGSSLC